MKVSMKSLQLPAQLSNSSSEASGQHACEPNADRHRDSDVAQRTTAVSPTQAGVRLSHRILPVAACVVAFIAGALIATRALPAWFQLSALALLGLGSFTAFRSTRTLRAQAESSASDRPPSTELPPDEALRTAFERSSFGLALLTCRGWIVQLNPRAERLLGQREAGLIGCLFAKNPRWSEAQRELLEAAVEEAAH